MNLIIIVIQLSIIYNIQSAAQNDAQACNSCCTAGIPGLPGNHGNTGAPGPIGPTGIAGNKGEQGPTGLQGNKGEQGPTGIQGNKGEQGPRGLAGDRGHQGNKGDMGTTGSIGIPGKLGPIGQKGEIGTTGEKGEKGQKGEQATQKKSAFSVVFTTDPGRVTGMLKYNTIITNLGNHYNFDTGKFVCVIPGTYVFQVTSTKSSGSGSVLTYIKKNGEKVVSAYTAADRYNTVSTMTVLELVANDEVWTEPAGSSTNYYFSNIIIYCSFSGFLLYAS